LPSKYVIYLQFYSPYNQQVVRKILFWILGYNNIICSFGFIYKLILLQVLVLGTSADLYKLQYLVKNIYNIEFLRDLYSCFIDIQSRTVREDNLEDLKDWERSKVVAETEIVEVVSCIHYTVKEYLYSERVRSLSAVYFALDNKEVYLEFSTSIFSQALNFTSPFKAYC
jgi:hypothetical protein